MKKTLFLLTMTTAIILLVPKGVIASDFSAFAHDTIYKPGNIFIFEAKVDSVSKNTQQSCYIVMRALDKEMYHQGVITYDYYNSLPDDLTALDSTSSVNKDGFIETGVCEVFQRRIFCHIPLQ